MAVVQALVGKFNSVRYEHTKRSSNCYVDALATLASKVPIETEAESLNVQVIQKSIHYIALHLMKEEEETQDDWHAPIRTQLAHPNAASVSTLKNFTRINDVLYFKGPECMLA